MHRTAVAALLLATACAGPRGFDRGALSRQLREEAPQPTDADVARALALRPQAPVPFKLAVHFRAGQPWTGADRDAVLAALEPLVKAGALAQVIPVADEVVTGHDLAAARLAAARYGADAVLVVHGAEQSDSGFNGWSILYLTGVGMFFVPGVDVEAQVLASGTVWDVRSEYLLASAEAEGTARATKAGPIDDHHRPTLEAARRRAAEGLGAALAVRLRHLAGAPQDSAAR